MDQAAGWRLLVIASVALVGALAIWLHGPIPQDPAYHLFADRRTLFGISNFWNVISNFPFLVVGITGMIALGGAAGGMLPSLRPSYGVVFLGSSLVCAGSAYYHLAPNNATLVWDRLPMTLAFMGFLSIIVGEHISPPLGRFLLGPFLLLGAGSVICWWLSDARGHGDLRLYACVQYVPVLIIPLILVLFPSRLTRPRIVWGVVAAYGAAKVLELLDGPLYALIGWSGHTFKHLVAAAGLFLVVVAATSRRPRTAAAA